MNHRLFAYCVCFALMACSGGSGAPGDAGVPDGMPDAFVGEATALFQVPRSEPPPDGFYALPYPNNIRVDDTTGLIDLADHLRPTPILAEYIDAVAANVRGFSLAAPGFFRFDNPIDPTSLPDSPEASITETASVYLVNIDTESPDYGARVPARYRFEPVNGEAIGRNWLSVLPFPGFVLRNATTYALVLTNRVRATDGTAVKRSPDFEAIIATTTPAEAELARAQTIYTPLWSWLDEAGGDERADVVAAAVFTTQNAVELMGKIREVIWSLPAPRARAIEWLRQENGYVMYDGMYDAPNFQLGNTPYSLAPNGAIITDEQTGLPVIQRTEELRFSFSIPTGPMPAQGWPVVLYQHGTGGSYHTYRNNGSARRLAAEGLAVISIDQVLHGPRNPGGVPDVHFFNFGNPSAARFNTLQGGLDNFSLLRLARNFNYTERHPGGRTIRFDPDRIYFFGHSQGGLTGPGFLAHEPLVKGAVLSGAGALLYLSLLNKTEPIDIAGIVGAFIRDYPLDEFNPLLGMLQNYLDISDPAVYARAISVEPLPGVNRKHIFHSEGLIDRYTPVPAIEAFAVALQSDPVEPVLQTIEGMSLRGHAPLTAPVTGNQDGVTNVLLQYNEEQGSDGHFVLFDIEAAKIQSAKFLGTLAQTGTATLVTPTAE